MFILALIKTESVPILKYSSVRPAEFLNQLFIVFGQILKTDRGIFFSLINPKMLTLKQFNTTLVNHVP